MHYVPITLIPSHMRPKRKRFKQIHDPVKAECYRLHKKIVKRQDKDLSNFRKFKLLSCDSRLK